MWCHLGPGCIHLVRPLDPCVMFGGPGMVICFELFNYAVVALHVSLGPIHLTLGWSIRGGSFQMICFVACGCVTVIRALSFGTSMMPFVRWLVSQPERSISQCPVITRRCNMYVSVHPLHSCGEKVKSTNAIRCTIFSECNSESCCIHRAHALYYLVVNFEATAISDFAMFSQVAMIHDISF